MKLSNIDSFFALVGGLLVSQFEARAALTDAPVNLYTGTEMIVFGLGMLSLAYRGRKSGGEENADRAKRD